MIEGISESIRLNAILENYDDDRLNKLYLKMFNTDDGKLILQDLANRCNVYVPRHPDNIIEARSVFLSIQTRLTNAITARKEG